MNPAIDLYTDEPVRLSGEDRTLLIELLSAHTLETLLEVKRGDLDPFIKQCRRDKASHASNLKARIEGRA